MSQTPIDRRRFLEAALAAGAAGAALAPLTGAAAAEPGRVPDPDAGPPPPLADVAGKVAFITGGSSGIGLGMARAFSAAGMKVVIAYVQEEQLRPALQFFRGPAAERVFAVPLDVTDRDAWPRAADEAERHFGPVQLLCNNAGIGVATPLSRASYRDWDGALAVNLGGVFNGIHTFVPRMLERGEGAQIVTTASVAGLLPVGSAGLYTTAKAATVAMSEALRGELAGENIGVSVFCPGLVHTNIIQDAQLRDRIMPAGMDPLEAGERVLRGVRANDLYILSHPEFRVGIQERFEAILASVPTGETVPQDRLEAERPLLRNPLYAQERDRRRRRQSP